MCGRSNKPKKIHVTAYEIDHELAAYLEGTLQQCREACEAADIAFEGEPIRGDFIDEGVRALRHEMFGSVRRFSCAIMNPPYKKINSDSATRLALREIGVETSNIYAGFLSIVLHLLQPGGELVAITPRSFCNGTYFRPFREMLLGTMTLRRIHLFDSRHVAFKENDVLQENVIFHGVKGERERETITVSSSTGPEADFITTREVPYQQVVRPSDREHYIHIVPDELGASIADHMRMVHSRLPDLNVEISTGRVVDFRATKFLRHDSTSQTVPLIYPRNFAGGFIRWPKPGGKKPQALALLGGAEELLVPKGVYVLVKRFSSKEERRRVVAAVYDPKRINAEQVGFENHTNYYHRNGAGLPLKLAKGLAAFLNSTLVDMHFRQFSGHTQVNATDLRNLKYPTQQQLEQLGSQIGEEFPNQETLDASLQEIFALADSTVKDPVDAKKKIDEAAKEMKSLGVPATSRTSGIANFPFPAGLEARCAMVTRQSPTNGHHTNDGFFQGTLRQRLQAEHPGICQAPHGSPVSRCRNCGYQP